MQLSGDGHSKVNVQHSLLIWLEVRSCTKTHMTPGTLALSLLPTYRHDVDDCAAIKEAI